jgi:hypothetical protein
VAWGVTMTLHDDLLPINAEVARLQSEFYAAQRRASDHFTAHRKHDWRLLAESRRLDREWAAAKEAARSAFAAARGWRRTEHPFHVGGLLRELRFCPRYTSREQRRELRDIHHALGRPYFDHPEYFKTPGRGGVCAGIVSHAYLRHETIGASARSPTPKRSASSARSTRQPIAGTTPEPPRCSSSPALMVQCQR